MNGPHGAAFSGRVGWGTAPAVLVVDLVRAYTDEGGPFLLPEPGPAVAATANDSTIISVPMPGTSDVVGDASAPPSAASVAPMTKVIR